MRYSDFVSGLFWLIVGLLLSIWSLTTYEVGILTRPGPGYLPLALGIIIILLSLILLFGHWKKRASPTKKTALSSPTHSRWKKMVYTVVVLLATGFFFETLGYLITIFLLIALLMMGAEPQSWKKALITAFLTTLGVYLIFVLLLEQPLPRGFLGV
jgi:hypothetical protein